MVVVAWVAGKGLFRIFAALAEKGRSGRWEGLVFFWKCSAALGHAGCLGSDLSSCSWSKSPQPGHREVIQKKLLRWELGKLHRTGLKQRVLPVAVGYCSLA